MTEKNRVIIFDTTLRDGEQSPGASMTIDQKVRLAHMLELMRVDVIEAGFPIASKNDYDGVVAITQAIRSSVICALARTIPADIEAAGKALQSAERGRIHTFISTSPRHMKFKLRMDEDDVLELIKKCVTQARGYTDDVEWSAEDGSRSSIPFLCRCTETAIAHGATTINIPDTVGYGIPHMFGPLIQTVIEEVPNSDQAVFSVHCHNDLGLATANSLAGLLHGARQVECTLNGLGERAGNAAMEEVVMAVRTRQDVLPFKTNIDTTRFTEASRLASAVSGFPVQPNKAVIGRNAFTHESGIHQDGVIKDRETYEIMDPKDVGREKSELSFSRHSGRNGIRSALVEAGCVLDDAAFAEVYERFQELVAHTKGVTLFELLEIVDDRAAAAHGPYEALASVVGGIAKDGNRTAQAMVTARVHGKDLETVIGHSKSGVVEACITAAGTAFKHPAELVTYEEQSLGEGTGCMSKAWITLKYKGHIRQASATDSDVVTAALKAYVNALNLLAQVVNEEASVPHLVQI